MSSTIRRIGLIAGMVLAIAPASAAATTTGDCSITVNGVAIERIGALSSPLELRSDDTLVVAGTGPAATEMVRVELSLGPVTVDSGSTTYRPASSDFGATIDLAEVSPYGVGLFRIGAATDTCTAGAWLRISGRSPFTTLTGLTAAGLALGGLTGLLGAIASRRRWSRAAAAAGGGFAGIGGAGLGQEFGRLQLSYPSLALCAAAGAAIGWTLGWLLRSDRSRRPEPEPEEEPEAARDEAEPRSATVLAAADRWTRPQPDPRPEPASPSPEPAQAAAPYWCYVLAEVDVFDLTDHTRVVAKLMPGAWYLCKREVGGWAHVSSGDGPDGWVAAASINRQG